MARPLDRTSPLPLYHQISEAIRYQIATGLLRPGASLPPLREAAQLWGANLHTVRRAYAELNRDRLVATRVPSGTVVLAKGPPSSGERPLPSALESFLGRIAIEAKHEHGLDLAELAGLLEARRPSQIRRERPPVYVSECSETQSQDLARQLMARWDIDALPWPVFRPEPPAGHPIVATYFHYQEIAGRWPSRLRDMRFMAISPDPALEKAVRKLMEPKKPKHVVLWERDASMLANIAQDLARVLPPGLYEVLPRLLGNPPNWRKLERGETPALFSPRIWGELPETVRSNPKALEVRYLFHPWELDEVGTFLGWRPASPAQILKKRRNRA